MNQVFLVPVVVGLYGRCWGGGGGVRRYVVIVALFGK